MKHAKAQAPKGKKMTVLGHLGELRQRLLKSVIALAITTTLSLVFANHIFNILIRQAPEGINLIYIELTEMIATYFKVGLTGGIVLAMPYLIYQAVMFASPALTRKEKRYVYLILPWIGLMFVAGVVFAYFLLVPPATKFLLSFGSDIATPQIRIANYITIVTRLLLAMGGVFETPVLITFLAWIGVVTPKWLADKRKWALIVAFVIAAIVTPTFDPVNQSLVAVPLILLYEMSIWLAKLVSRKKAQPAPSIPSPISQE